MREAWTDERLDDLSERMDRRFDEMAVRFDAVQHNILPIGGGVVGALLVGLLGLIATQI